jgi:hypothetical protein
MLAAAELSFGERLAQIMQEHATALYSPPAPPQEGERECGLRRECVCERERKGV